MHNYLTFGLQNGTTVYRQKNCSSRSLTVLLAEATLIYRIALFIISLAWFVFPAHAEEPSVDASGTQTLSAEDMAQLGKTMYPKINFDSIQKTPLCKSTGVLIYGNASHPGGNPYDLLNERNDGVGFICYTNTPQTDFVAWSALINSKFGLATSAAWGRGITVIDWSPVRLDVGVAVTALSYEIPGGSRTPKNAPETQIITYRAKHAGDKRRVLYGILPFPYAKLALQVPVNRWGMMYIGVNETYLESSLNGVRLRNVEFGFKGTF